MNAKRILLALAALLPLSAGAQRLHVVGSDDGLALYVNPAHLWTYNHYEHSRWGIGGLIVYHNHLTLNAYIAYGTLDQRWKYGLTLSEQARIGRFYLGYRHDYTAAGSRRLANPWNNGLSLLGDFMASRMVERQDATLGYSHQTSHWQWAAEINAGRRAILFDDKHLIYTSNEEVTYSKFLHLRLLLRHTSGAALQVEGAPDGSMLRALAEYRKTHTLKHTIIDLYAQCGISPSRNTYADLFDLGGMWGSPLYLSRFLSTALPNEFTANAFALVSAQLRLSHPLFRIYNSLFNIGSNPIPFIGLTAAWGHLWHQDADGQRPWLDSQLQAPHMGILEPTLGMNGIIHFGAVDWGAAITYRLTPANAAYSRPEPRNNLMVILTAQLTL